MQVFRVISTPTQESQQDKQHNRPLHLLNVNFQSVVGKKAEIANLLESIKPDVVVGTETWLQPEVNDSEYLPANYKAVNKDRVSKKEGGVLIATREDLQCTVVPELDTECSSIWIKLLTPGCLAVYICAYYRPDVSDEESLKQFETSLQRATTIRNTQILVAGDMSFPGGLDLWQQRRVHQSKVALPQTPPGFCVPCCRSWSWAGCPWTNPWGKYTRPCTDKQTRSRPQSGDSPMYVRPWDCVFWVHHMPPQEDKQPQTHTTVQ